MDWTTDLNDQLRCTRVAQEGPLRSDAKLLTGHLFNGLHPIRMALLSIIEVGFICQLELGSVGHRKVLGVPPMYSHACQFLAQSP